MAGDWIKMRNNLWDDPRVTRICDITNSSESAIVGGLYWLWAAADEHSEDGFMSGLTTNGIDRKTQIKGFGTALISVGWLADGDSGVTIQRFNEHNGMSAKKRCVDAQRKHGVRKVSEKKRTKSAESRTDSGQKAENIGTREEKRREEKIDNTKTPLSPLLNIDFPTELDSETCRIALKQWLDFRAARKPNVEPGSIPAILKKWARAGPAAFIDAVENSIANGYQGLFESKVNANGKPGRNLAGGPGQTFDPNAGANDPNFGKM